MRRLDWLARLAGSDAHEALYDAAVAFLRGGGSVTPKDWRRLSVRSRATLEAAGDALAARDAAEVAAALTPGDEEVARETIRLFFARRAQGVGRG